MEKRLFLFFALTMLVFLGTQYFFKPAPIAEDGHPHSRESRRTGSD